MLTTTFICFSTETADVSENRFQKTFVEEPCENEKLDYFCLFVFMLIFILDFLVVVFPLCLIGQLSDSS